jgi:hypothetical protein
MCQTRGAAARRWAPFAACAFAACAAPVGPSIEHPGEVSAPVGEELRVALHGTAPAGMVSFDFMAPDLPDLKQRMLAARLTNYADGEALFRWTPLATDLGRHEVDFIADAAGVESTASTVIDVIPGVAAPPVFREPVGEGTVLELQRGPCSEVAVLVDDTTVAEVTLALEPPLVPNAKLMVSGPTAGTLDFCPSAAQAAAATVYPILLSADDGQSAKAFKLYTVVVRP